MSKTLADPDYYEERRDVAELVKDRIRSLLAQIQGLRAVEVRCSSSCPLLRNGAHRPQ